jgi:hypothetical protein
MTARPRSEANFGAGERAMLEKRRNKEKERERKKREKREGKGAFFLMV